MERIHTLIIGAGQAGLALSRCLTERGIEHLLLERGRVAQRWSERWDSLRLLTPNWMTRLPGFRYDGNDPNGYMQRDEVLTMLRNYARSFDAPVLEETAVLDVRPLRNGWRVGTTRGAWLADNVVIATGHCAQPRRPSCANDLDRDIAQFTTMDYRNPAQLPDGGVLVVGASASGVQLARELRRAGREVILSVGRHTRVPRRYRGRDIHYWLDRTGLLARPLSDMNAERARREPSLQVIGDEENLDLAELTRLGVRLTGRLAAIDGTQCNFADDLAQTTHDADRQLHKLLTRIDTHIAAHGAERFFPSEPRPMPIHITAAPQQLDLRANGIRNVLWATGYTRSYPWLYAPVLDANGEILQSRGRTPMRGLYVLGLQFMTRRNSSLIDGVGRDAAEIAAQIATTRMENAA